MKCFSIDLDGTLLNSNSQISEENSKHYNTYRKKVILSLLIRDELLKMFLNSNQSVKLTYRLLALMEPLYIQMNRKFYTRHQSH